MAEQTASAAVDEVEDSFSEEVVDGGEAVEATPPSTTSLEALQAQVADMTTKQAELSAENRTLQGIIAEVQRPTPAVAPATEVPDPTVEDELKALNADPVKVIKEWIAAGGKQVKETASQEIHEASLLQQQYAADVKKSQEDFSHLLQNEKFKETYEGIYAAFNQRDGGYREGHIYTAAATAAMRLASEGSLDLARPKAPTRVLRDPMDMLTQGGDTDPDSTPDVFAEMTPEETAEIRLFAEQSGVPMEKIRARFQRNRQNDPMFGRGQTR